MSAPLTCPPAQIETVRHTRFLGPEPVPAGQQAKVLGMAADDRFVYTTYHRHAIRAPHGSPDPGLLVVLDQALLADPATDPVVARVPVGHRPTKVAVNPRTGKVYVLTRGEVGDSPFSLYVVRRGAGDTFAVTATIALGGGVVDLAVNPRANRAYVSNWAQVVPADGPPVNGKIHVIDGAADVQLADRALSVARPLGLAFDPGTETLYATLSQRVEPRLDAVAAISCGADGATLAVQKIVPLPPTSEPVSAAVLAGGGLHRLYVGVQGSTPTGPVPPNLTRFELDGTYRSSTVRTAFGGPVALAVDTQARQLYVTTNAGLQVLDAVGETITAAEPVSPFPQSVGVDPAGRVHVGDGVDGTLTTVLPVVTTGPVGAHWAETGGAGGLGRPVTGYRLLPGGDPRAGYQVFEQGAVFASTDYGAVTLSRELTAAWEQSATRELAGGTAQSLLGVPVEPAPPGSTLATFQRGVLVRVPPAAGRAAVGAFTVVGDIYDCYVRSGVTAALGLPVEDQQSRPDGGLRQRFEHGEICWRSDLGAFAVRNPIAAWWGPAGPDGPLGYPTRDVVPFDRVYETVTVHWFRGSFERGDLYAARDGESAWVVRGEIRDAYENRFGGPQGKLGVPVDDERPTPSSGGTYQNFENGVLVWHPPGHPHAGARMFRSAQLSIASFMLVDEDDGPLSEIGAPIDDTLPFRQNYFWQLHNFDTARLDMDQYARTFADVDSSEPWWSFDPVPVFRLGHPQVGGDFPGEPDPVLDRGMINEFNVKHGYQVGAPTVAWFLQLFGLGLTHDPKEIFRMARTMFEDGDRPVLSFTRFIKFKGHTVLPIRFLGGDDHPEELPPGSDHWGEIWIADVKREWGYGGGPDFDGRYRVIIKDDNSFEYDNRYAGGAWFGDRMFAEPWHLLDRVPTLPGADLFLEGAKGFVALLSGDADGGAGDAAVQQVVDGAGRTLFEPGLGRAPDRWSDLRRDPAARIPGLAPIPISAGDAESVGPRPLLFFGRGQDTTHTYQVTGGGGTYRFGIRAPAVGAVVTARGGAVADHITASRLGTADRSIAFAVPPGGTAKEVGLVLDGLPRSARGKQFLVDGLQVGPKQRIGARLRDGGRELLLENSGGATSCRVRVRPAPGATPTAARPVPLAAGKVTRVRPADWRPGQVGSAPLQVEVRDTVDGPPVTCFQV